jgi:hypothetical protein
MSPPKVGKQAGSELAFYPFEDDLLGPVPNETNLTSLE